MPWYVRNIDVRRDLRVPDVATEMKHFGTKHEARRHQHFNTEATGKQWYTSVVRQWWN